MELMRINDVVSRFHVSSRTLRYYEEVGILFSEHPGNKQQRYYSEAALDRLCQIIVLRKMQIPIKDIVYIFQNNDMKTIVESFVRKLSSIDKEIGALHELRQIVDTFLAQILVCGISKISAITLLYEETEKRLNLVHQPKITADDIAHIQPRSLSLSEVRIVRLPTARYITSRRKDGTLTVLQESNMQDLFLEYGISANPGQREGFFVKRPCDKWVMLVRIPMDYDNQSPYEDMVIPEGLFAAIASLMDELDEKTKLLSQWCGQQEEYILDADESGNLNRDILFEELIPWDISKKIRRFQQDIFIPIRLLD